MRRTILILLVAVASWCRAGTLLDESAQVDPQAVDIVRHAAVHALLAQPTPLADDVHDAEALDTSRRDRGLAPAGLADDVRLLAAGLRPTRDARRDALEEVLDDDPDPAVERFARYALEHEDDAGAGDQLLADDRHNRRASIVNDAIRPLGVFSGGVLLAAVNPFLAAGSALDSVVTTAVNLYHYNDLSPREREALVRYRRQLAKDPNTMAAPDIIDTVRSINAKRTEAVCKDTVAAAEKALDANDLDAARFYVESAGRLSGCDDKVAKIREKVSKALAIRSTRTEAARWPADDLELPEADERVDYEAVATATVLRDPAGMMEAAQRFAQRHDDSDHDRSVTLVVGVARDLAGNRDGARDALDSIASKKSETGRTAQAMLDDPRFNGLNPLDAAERRHARDVAQYVLVGGGPTGRSAIYTAAQLGAEGASAAQTLGIFNVIGMLTRAWSAWRNDPASNQAIIDEGEQFLAREPDSPDASDVHERLATAYERAGHYDRALLHYRAVANPQSSRIEKLEGKIADQLLENAKKDGGEPVLLAAIVHYYPDSDAAAKAREALEKLPKPGAIPLSRDTLVAHPALLGPSGLDLDPKLLDGDRDNGELGETGVTVLPGTLELSLRSHTGGDDYTERRPISPEAYTRARAAAEDALYASVLVKDPRDPEIGRFEKYIPVYINGGLGESGVAITPGIKMRRDNSEDRALYQ